MLTPLPTTHPVFHPSKNYLEQPPYFGRDLCMNYTTVYGTNVKFCLLSVIKCALTVYLLIEIQLCKIFSLALVSMHLYVFPFSK